MKKVKKYWITIRGDVESHDGEKTKSQLWNNVGAIENLTGIRINEIDVREVE